PGAALCAGRQGADHLRTWRYAGFDRDPARLPRGANIGIMRFFAAALNFVQAIFVRVIFVLPIFVLSIFVPSIFVTPVFGQCDFTVTPTTVNVGSAAFTGTITVTTSSSGFCLGWTANSNVPWLKITSVSNTVFPGAANYSVDANISANARSGVMMVANKTVTVTQAAATCSFGISPKTTAYAVSGGAGFFLVQANCAWQAVSGNSWIAVTNNAIGITDGSVNYTVAANPCVSPLSGAITVLNDLNNPPVFSIAQEGSPGNLTLSS